ncbi:MAG: OmpA family protein, partial [Spirochaetales bacterium]|nr:OmpA family protein [Spirochaetales bacterium]
MEKLRVFFIAIMLCLPLCSVFSQIADIKTLSEEDTYREKLLSDTEISSRNKTWEGVALSLLVPDIEKSAEDSGLESFSISITDNTINIIYRDIRFQPNSAEVTPETITKLQKLSKILKRFSEMGLVIEGHTAKLSESDNDDGMELSENRAKSVAAVIAETGIFEAKNIHAVGKGFYEPVEEGFSAENKALNRRVEISIGGAPDSEDGKSTEEKSETLWWDFLSKSMNPGYTACLVHNKTVEEVQAALSEAGIDGLILAPTEDGVGILDSSMAFRMNDSPNTKSVEHIKALGKALASLGKDTEVRVGGYNTAIKEESIEERHYLTAYTMASVGGLSPDKIFFGKEGHVLTKSTTALVSKSISKVDGTILE